MMSAMVWWRRFAIALVAGVCVGAIAGWVGLRQLTGPTPPPRAATVADSDTVASRPATRRVVRGPRADGMRAGADGGALVGGGRLASRDSVAIVPDLIGRVEGDARRLLQSAGFTVGAVEFRIADLPDGTVLETDPVAGSRVSLPAEVRLTLATRVRDDLRDSMADSIRDRMRNNVSDMLDDSLWRDTLPHDQRTDSTPSDTLTHIPHAR